MKENILKNKSYSFALRIINLYKYLIDEKKEKILSKQILRSWTAIWALVREWEYWQSRIDFIHKLSIALKEANETDYWIDLLTDSGYLNNKQWESIKKESVELIKILTSIIKTSKNN